MQKQIIFYTQAYNAEQYLEKAITSILNQTYTNFLYYIVDDGSSDGTREIIQKYATLDSRIKPIYHDSNSYLNCYNETLKQIYSEKEAVYFAFLDADDWYEPTFAETGIQCLEDSKVDLYICGSIFESPSGKVLGARQWKFDKYEFSSTDVPDYFPYLHSFFRTCWAKIYRISQLKQHQVMVPTTLPVGFDTGFFFQYLTYTQRFIVSSENLHHYLVDPNSTSYRYIPNRIAYDEELSQTTYEYLKTIDGATPNNLFFYNIINLNAFYDTFKVAFRAYRDNKTTLKELEELLNSNFLVQTKHSLHNLLPLTNSYKYLLENFRSEVVTYLFSEYQEQDNEIFFMALKDLVPTLSLFFEPEDMKEFFSKELTNKERLEYLLHSEEACLEAFSKYMLTPEEFASFDSTLIGLLELYCNHDFSTIIKKLEHYQTFSPKQIAYIISKHPILEKVENSERIFSYPSLLLPVLKEEYDVITKALPDQIQILSSTEPKTALILSRIGSYTAALASMEDYYIFFLKVELELLYELQCFSEAKNKLEELLPFLPNDQELLELQKKLNLNI